MSFRSQNHRNNHPDGDILFSVFFINKGYLMGLYAYKDTTVEDLQRIITERNKIPVKEQMLFLVDGSRPNNDILLTEHDIGTNKKPIFLYRRVAKDEVEPLELGGISQVKEDWDAIMNKALATENFDDIKKAVLSTVEKGRLIKTVCNKVVTDHQYLAKAWSAMVLHLESQIGRTYKRCARLESIMKKMETAKASSGAVLEDFNDVFDKLKKIPLPPQMAVAMSGSESDDEEYTLYDWIRSKDPVFHLDDLVGHVQLSLNSLDDSEIKRIKPDMDEAKRQLDDKQVRSIGGLKDRLVKLDERLQSTLYHFQGIEKAINELGSELSYLNCLKPFGEQFTNMVEDARTFSRSKAEVLQALIKRVRNNFIPIYDKLAKADFNMLIFEEKSKALIDQLNLLNQIRETPILYVTAVAEVIRRQTLQKEFKEWMELMKEKCTAFLEEENQTRSAVHGKLERHFLRQLFRGVNQLMPAFNPQVDNFDINLPNIDNSYLHMLREKFQDMSVYLNVTAPEVIKKLAIQDKNAPNINEVSHQTLRREESFFVHGRTINIETMNRNFPSTNFLSGLDAECSPGSLNMSRFGPCSSQTSLFSDSGTPTSALKPLVFDCRPKEESSISPQKAYSYSSDPIAIPNRGVPNPSQMSATSSQFSTPDDTISNERFRQPYHSPKSFSGWMAKSPLARLPEQTDGEVQERKLETSVEQLKEFKTAINSLQTQIVEIRDMVNEESETIKVFDKENIDEIWRQIGEEIEKQVEEQKKIVAEVTAEKVKLAEIVEHEKYLRKEKEKEVVDQSLIIERQNNELLEVIKAKDDLHVDILRLETEKRKLEERLHSETCVDFLGIELKTLEDILRRPLAQDEVDRIKSEIEKRRVSSPTPSDQTERENRTSNSQVEYEKAYRTKMMFIIQGIENKKVAEIAKMRDEIYNDMKAERDRYEKSLLERVKDLEEKVSFYQNLEEQQSKGPFVDVSTIAANNAFHSEPVLPKNMIESCMVVNPTTSSSKAAEFPPTHEENEYEEEANDDDDVISINTVSTQTRIDMEGMKMMISLRDIHEGCSVLVMWDNSHNSYMVFSTSRTLHFVRESSMRRFGIDPQSPNRRNWMFAVVTKMEYCQIRKESNRYNMPMDTRFHRVEVKPLAIEQSSSAPIRRT